MTQFNLDGKRMNVVKTAETGVVNAETIFRFQQRGDRVIAKYAGGRVLNGCLVGRAGENTLDFHYLQIDNTGRFDSGNSSCSIEQLDNGCLRLIEKFQWASRGTAGVNVFEEIQ